MRAFRAELRGRRQRRAAPRAAGRDRRRALLTELGAGGVIGLAAWASRHGGELTPPPKGCVGRLSVGHGERDALGFPYVHAATHGCAPAARAQPRARLRSVSRATRAPAYPRRLTLGGSA